MKKIFFFTIIFAVLLPSCQQQQVRKAPVRNEWTAEDSKTVAEKMIKDILNHHWLEEAMEKKGGKKPVITVGEVVNKSSEHIETEMFVKDLQVYLNNSREIEFVTGGRRRTKMRKEVKDQVMNATDDTAKGPGEEIGADYILFGQMNAINNRSGGRHVRFYQIELELHEVGTNKIVWIGQEKIERVTNQARRTW